MPSLHKVAGETWIDKATRKRGNPSVNSLHPLSLPLLYSRGSRQHHQSNQQCLFPTASPLALSSLSACSLLSICEPIHSAAKGFQCPQWQSPHCISLCCISLEVYLARLRFPVACWSGTKLWENHWHDATVVCDFGRKDPGCRLSGGPPSKLSQENPTRRTSVLRENQRVSSPQSVEL